MCWRTFIKALQKTSIREILPWEISWHHHGFLSSAIHQRVYYWHLDLDQNQLPFQIYLLAKPWLHRWWSSHCWLSWGPKRRQKSTSCMGSWSLRNCKYWGLFFAIGHPKAERNRFSWQQNVTNMKYSSCPSEYKSLFSANGNTWFAVFVPLILIMVRDAAPEISNVFLHYLETSLSGPPLPSDKYANVRDTWSTFCP